MEPLLLNQLIPAGMPAGSPPFVLRALGQGFLPTAALLVDGAEGTTVYIGPTDLQTSVTPGAEPGEMAITVRQMDAQGQTQYSESLPFPFLPPAPAGETNRFAPDNVPYPYLRYDIETRYFKDSGTLQMPIAGPPSTPAAVIQVCAPYGRKVVNFVLERQGADPEPPAPTDDPANGVILKRQEIRPISKRLMADGLTHVHRMTGRYVYLLTLPQDETGPLQIGSPPYDLTPPEENLVSPGQYKPGII